MPDFRFATDFKKLGFMQRSLALACAYSLFWDVFHAILIGQLPGLAWLVPELISSILIFYSFNGLFYAFSFYRKGALVGQVLTSILYLLPFFQVLFYQTYRFFLKQQTSH